MASHHSTSTSLFSKAVIRAVQKLYPEQLADTSFDNTGLLLEAPFRPGLKDSVLLTVDLTQAVVNEAIEGKDSIIVTYHPIIFRPLKSLTLGNTQQSSLLRLAQEGISVYSPHTAVDAAPNGLNDFLADLLVKDFSPLPGTTEPTLNIVPHNRTIITPVKNPPEGFEDAGYGKILRFHKPQKLGDLLGRITSRQLGLNVTALSVAVPQGVPMEKRSSIEINTVGICAGSGGSILSGLSVDLLFTGELSHHEALAAIEQGKCVITTFHSNSERDFLKYKLRLALTGAVEDELNDLVENGERESAGCTVRCSKYDADPFTVFTTGDYQRW